MHRKELSLFTNGQPQLAAEFKQFCCSELRNLAKFAAENCGP